MLRNMVQQLLSWISSRFLSTVRVKKDAAMKQLCLVSVRVPLAVP